MADKYANIPEKYRHFCHEDDVEFAKKSIFANAFLNLRLFIIAQQTVGRTFEATSREYYTKRFASRKSHYRAIASDYKLNINPAVHPAFESEYDKIMNAMDAGNPITWVHYFLMIEWCMKFAETHPIKEVLKQPEPTQSGTADVNVVFNEILRQNNRRRN